MRRALALLLLLLPAAARDILDNGDVGKGDGWGRTPGAPTVTMEVDRKTGKRQKGSLLIANTNEDDETPHNWFTRFDVPKGTPCRLKLTVQARTEGLGEGAEANVMVQVYPKEGQAIGYAWCAAVTKDTDWTGIQAVFDVPKGAAYVRVLAYLVGKGKVWYDDFKVEKTDDPVSRPPPARKAKDDKMWKLVRSAAEEIPWLFDAAAAQARAAKEKRPILLYVRCVDDDDGYVAARTSLRAESIPARDDGLKKDVLFRAGPLSDPDVAALITGHTVPLLLTYDLGTHGVGGNDFPGPDGKDPLKSVGLRAPDVITPALVVLDGKRVVKLHRIGTMSTDLVAFWLLRALDETLDDAVAKGGVEGARALLLRGDLDAAEKTLARVKSPEAAIVRGRIALRRGKWGDALGEFLDAGGTDEARFFQAWCMHFAGKQAEAEAEWKAIAGPTRFGRRAAACVLPNGPRLWLSASEASWPRGRKLPEESEGYGDGFDGPESVRALLLLQNADGSFGGHDGAVGEGWNDGAITALASEALALWAPRVPKSLGAGAARERALEYLEQWARRENGGGAAFNNPYVLMELVRAGSKGGAGAMVARIVKGQLPDGNWTVYQAERPASFNTALNVLALRAAREAGVSVPKAVLSKGVAALAAMRQDGDLFPYSTMKGHEWMTTPHGSIARDALCERALLANGEGDARKLVAALGRFEKFGKELRLPTKQLYDYFNARGHGGYYFFFAHRNAYDASALVDGKTRERVRAFIREGVLAAREGDGTFMDHQMIGRAYATAQALVILAAP
ncbi:MAG TPA: hypothetical protein VFY93_15460 [Planctomycetota bacterium]|nr:hypothetical protein [Planctomycetota bacterium]